MQDMSANNDAVYGASFVGADFRLTDVGVVLFSVTGLTAGEIKIKYQPKGSGDWFDLDSTELVFTADGAKYAVIGGCAVRAVGDSSVASGTNNLFVGIEGANVHRRNG